MHVSLIEYRLSGVDREEWARVCVEQLAPVFAAVPGLVSKIWLTTPDGQLGGVYVWEDEESYRAFLAGDLGAALAAHPHIAGLTMRDWRVDEAPTAITTGRLQPA
ncbi:YdhR family protein [Geodermatophilus marinus]|uniref:YdhR family protein n=1 Tax=Geodermatophilus sp. LHW52908 TaxID=2303986 RepID=UPI001314ACED|nr:YdhR family protein [Geodermatophilus sp. LHW52908]